MRRLTHYAAFLLMIGAIFMFSCGEDDGIEPIGGNPSITFSGEDADSINASSPVFEAEAGETFDVTVLVDAPDGFNVLRVNKIVDGSSTQLEEYTRTSQGQTDFSTTFSYTVMAEDADATTEIEFEAVDDDNDTTTETIEIIVSEPMVNNYSTVLLASPLADGSSATFFSSEDGNVYSSNDVTGTSDPISETIDFGYYYGATDMASLASPNAYPTSISSLSGWSTLNSTELRVTALTSGQFDETSTAAAIQAAFDGATAGGDPEVVSNLSVGDVVAFQTDANKADGSRYGLLIVKNIVEGTSADGEIQIDVKAVN
ncbi:MAG: hypothetical protein WBB45_09030 [Cyclobacteriaceae bacterium]